METAIKLEGTTSATVKEIRATIIAILSNARADESTKVEALKALQHCAVNNLTVTGCTFQSGVKA